MKIIEAINIVREIEHTIESNRDFMCETGQGNDKIEPLTKQVIAIELIINKLESFIKILEED